MSVDPVILMASVLLGKRHAQRQVQRKINVALTPAQIAQRERDEWNDAVEKRKAEKKSRKP